MQNIEHYLKGKQWYHQRFDGASLYIYFIGEAEVRRERRKPKGTEANVRASFFTSTGKSDWYLDMADVRRGAAVMIRLAKRDPQISTKLLRAWHNDEQKFQDFFDHFDRVNLRKLSDRELLLLYQRYYALAVNRFTSSAIIDHFALGTDEHIAKMIRQEIGKVETESDFTEIFSIATAPVHQSFINEAEMELLKIAIEHNPPQPSLTLREGDRSKPPLKIRGDRGSYEQAFEKALTRYQSKHFWIKNNYFTAQILSVAHFKKEIELWQRSGADLRTKYKQLRDTPKINAKKKTALFQKYKFSQLLRTLLKISEDFTWWQDERKKSTFLNIHLGTQILGEMARRRGVDPELTKYLVPREVEKWFLESVTKRRNSSLSDEQLRARQKGCVVVHTHKGYYIGTGKEVERVRKLMFPKKVQDTVRDIRGLAASVGRAVGRVKVVGSAREVGKVERGDILVAVMTRPDYIAGIKRASAIVTNEGGITCHAAIVSRELGIPCVIGTKIATEVLKDGDTVEVNANHGVVTVLKRIDKV